MFLPQFSISSEILKNIGLIEAAKEIITTAPLVPAWEKEFQSQAQVRTIHYGTHLEGNDLSFDQAKKVIEGVKIFARERDVWEVINYRNVSNYIETLGEKNKEDNRFNYSEDILIKIHCLTVDKLLNRDQCGLYRRAKVVIKDTQTGNIIFKPISPLEVPFQIEDFFTWLNSDIGRQAHSIIRAGIAHFELVRIHPFVDGNGRVARAFATLVLFIEGYDIKRFFSLEEHFDRDSLSYYQALGSVTIQKNLTSWLEYFTKVLAVELTEVKEKVRRLSLDINLKDRLGRQIALSERQIKIVEHLKIHDRLLMKEAKKILPTISEDTILRDLRELMEKGLVKKIGKTKASHYTLAK